MAQSTKKESIDKLLDLLLESLEEFAGRMKPIDRVKGWVKQYEDDSKLDELIAIVTQEVIGRIGQSITKEIKRTKSMTGRRSIEIASRELRKMADGFDKQLAEGEEFSGLNGEMEEEDDE